MPCLVPLNKLPFIEGVASLACKYKGWMPVMTLSIFAYQPNAFLAFSLPLLSRHPFPLFFVGPHRSLQSSGPLVTNKISWTHLI